MLQALSARLPARLPARLAAAFLPRMPGGFPCRIAPLRPEWVTLLASLFLLAFCNVPFWAHLLRVHPLNGANAAGLVAAFGFIAVTFNLALTVLAWRYLLRPVLAVLLPLTALVTWFMQQYGVLIDAGMVRNAVQTDYRETYDLLTAGLAIHVFLLGLLPAWLLWKLPIDWRPAGRECGAKAIVILLSMATLGAIAAVHYQTFASVARNHRELRLQLAPLNYIQAVHGYLKRRDNGPRLVAPFGTDARLGAGWAMHARKSLTVIVVGETARADHFSLNGYARDTTPRLAAQAGVISFRDVQSCGTETAVSLPCMFSGYTRQDFSTDKASQREGLLDMLQRAGLAVEWIDNQSGCKGVCERVPSETLRGSSGSASCTGDECMDAALADALETRLKRPEGLQRDTVLVLHMMGSHGPAYHRRYPADAEAFSPACATSQLDRCSQAQIVNAYDNSIRYTDAVLSRIIDLLRGQADRLDTAMIYLSDHGESLGEHGLYLHAAPWMFAPDSQKQVPMLTWFSSGYQRTFGVDTSCLSARRGNAYSHDNLFHSVLGLLQVETGTYRPELDLFRACRRAV